MIAVIVIIVAVIVVIVAPLGQFDTLRRQIDRGAVYDSNHGHQSNSQKQYDLFEAPFL